jgi:Arc/MetJ-type ribon-helix-helix transcriptional regulator
VVTGRSRAELVREAIHLLLGTGDAAAIDAAIVAGYERSPASERDPWAFQSAVAAIKAEPGSPKRVWWVEHPDVGRLRSWS